MGGRDVRIYDPVAGGEALLVINVGSEVHASALFTDPAGRAAARDGSGQVFDPVAGGEALVVLNLNHSAGALAALAGSAQLKIACALGKKVLVFDPVAGGEALLVLDIGSKRAMHWRWRSSRGSSDGRAHRSACGGGMDGDDLCEVRVFDAVSGGDALLMLDAGCQVNAIRRI